MGECTGLGQTVSIDLGLPPAEQRAQYRKNHKRQINKLKSLGTICQLDPEKLHLKTFVDIYQETMQRVGAGGGYLFNYEYFENLMTGLGRKAHLFVCLLEGTIICGGLFTLCDGIVQAHLVGMRGEYYKLSPTKLLFDTVRLWANQQEARVFHLGGGVSSHDDSLFHFKAGFSNRRHEFSIWKWVLLPEVNERLCREKEAWSQQHPLEQDLADYFPQYRCPDCPELPRCPCALEGQLEEVLHAE
jgi:hypothetical protein